LTRARQRGPKDDQQATQPEEGEVPAQGSAQVVAHMMDAEDLMVDQTLDKVEYPPAEQHQSDVHPPGRRQLTPLPSPDREEACGHYEHPRGQVEEAIRERVGFQAGNGVHGLATPIPREYVMPLEHLVEHDAVDEST
jgi:hypothetical protein